MDLYSKSKSYARFYAFSMVIAAILVCASVSAAFGQGRSEDRDNPAVQGGESTSKAVTFDKPQTLTILVQVNKETGSGKGTYSIQVSGPATVVR